jgi:hypothetical protein
MLEELQYTPWAKGSFLMKNLLVFILTIVIHMDVIQTDRLCGLVVRVLGYRSGGPGSIPGNTRKKKEVGLERGPLSLVSTTEELLDRKLELLSRKPRIRP